MPPKRPPAPIDRPLSKAYLRQFSGWSTAYPPGASEPNSLRVMHNVQVTREGAVRVRPGLRSYMATKTPHPIVGSHELFYLDDGRKAYLVAVRETVDVGTENEREVVSFRVICADPDTGVIEMMTLDDGRVGFTFLTDASSIAFTGATTYVRYLQIDNKIFALSNAPEGMVMFWVGGVKQAKKLESILRPEWTVADKLDAMHPLGTWVTGNQPSSARRNLCTNPDFEENTDLWSKGYDDMRMFWSTLFYVGSRSLGCQSKPSITNYVLNPLHNVGSTGLTGWKEGPNTNRLSVEGSSMRIHGKRQATDSFAWAMSWKLDVPGGSEFRFGFDLTRTENVNKWMTAVRFFRSNGDQIGQTERVGGNGNLDHGRKYSRIFTIPSQATKMRVLIGCSPTKTNVNPKIDIKNVTLNERNKSTSALSGDDGTYYFWEGAVANSRSVYHPPRDIWVDSDKVGASPGNYVGSAYVRADAGLQVEVKTQAFNASGTELANDKTIVTASGDWERITAPTLAAPTDTTRVNLRVIARDVERDQHVRVDAAMLERAASVGDYFSGATPNAGGIKYRWAGDKHASQSLAEVFDPVAPSAETPGGSTLVSSNEEDNVYTFSFFYTISNELGESAASRQTTIKTQRPWVTWEWKQPDGSDTDDPELCADQLIVTMPQEVFDAAIAAGATKWTAYFSTWGPNDVPPVTGIRFAEIDLSNEADYIADGYARLTPQQVKLGSSDPVIPTEETRFNATDPSKGSQGLVAADRLVLVGDPSDPARITWSSGQPGEYYNFSPLLGGGTKQLTSGNLYVTAAVKLWQNPQSVDTLTVLTMGDDGRSNAYYMQPAEITSLSESISVMGFEETTGMDGTTAPYGCEVVNNGLYRPMHHALLKSTANNYNISTRTMTDEIQNMWRVLQNQHRIVSATLDNRIYYLVHNILGDTLEENCRGNEVWVMDLASKNPTWSRWAVQGVSLRAIEIDNVVMMSIVRPDGIFAFSEDRYDDERFDPDTGLLGNVNIPWYLETNTQGANRAHDAWCNLQQANVTLGNFQGQLRYGIRGQDVNGMRIDMEKVVLSDNPPPLASPDTDESDSTMPTLSPTDREDYFLVRKIMKEWIFFAGSINDEIESTDPEVADPLVVPRFSGGQVTLVQYRYTPVTVNVGYEYGSVETFEYGRSADADATTTSGTPIPYVDLTRA